MSRHHAHHSPHHRAPWRRLTGVVALVAATLAPAACGVPTSGNPVVDRTIARDANGGIGSQVYLPPTAQQVTDDPASFVSDGYLKAIAGLAPGDQVSAAAKFMSRDLASSWTAQAKSLITIVRGTPAITDIPRSGSSPQTVTGTFQVVGSFDPSTGILSPTTGPASEKLVFQTVRSEGEVYFHLAQAPPMLLMSDQALEDDHYYQQEIVYAWASDSKRTNLIPDIRYVRQSLFATPGRAAHEIVASVISGAASGWISDAVAPPVAPKLQLSDAVAVPVQNGRYQIDLSANTAASLSVEDVAWLNYQTRWSLGQQHAEVDDVQPSPVDILVNGAPRFTDSANSNAYIQNVANLAPLAGRTQWIIYVIADGRVVRWAPSPAPVPAPSPSSTPAPKLRAPDILNVPQNQDVLSAAISGDETAGAIVRAQPGRQEELWVSRTSSGKMAVGKVAGVPAAGLSKPQFLLMAPGELAVAGGGQLYLIGPDNVASRVTAPDGVGTIDAFSVGPDGRRVAFVSRGKLYLAVLMNIGSAHPTLTTPHEINVSPALATVNLVAWASMRQLTVAGHTASGVADTFAVNSDGAALGNRYLVRVGIGTTISQMSAYVYDPLLLTAGTTSPLLLQTSRGPWRDSNQLDSSGRGITAPFFQD